MPNCRNCGARISKFDKDICPVCGTKNPLDGVSSETVEITSQIDLNNFVEGQKVVCRRKKMLILFLACGFTASQFFYLKRKKFAIRPFSGRNYRSYRFYIYSQLHCWCNILFLTRSKRW